MPPCTTDCSIGDLTQEMNRQLEERPVIKEQFNDWVAEVDNMGKEFPLIFPDRDDVIMPQWAIKVRLKEVLCRGKIAILRQVHSPQLTFRTFCSEMEIENLILSELPR